MTDEELLYGMLECPLLLDYLPRDERVEELLSQWKNAGCPDFGEKVRRDYREGKLDDQIQKAEIDYARALDTLESPDGVT